jgi:hypothetical protein
MSDVSKSSEPAALERLASVLTEDAIFAAASGMLERDTLDALAQRRAAVYEGALKDAPQPRMMSQFDAWLVAMARAAAPVAAPTWVPMMEVVREKVTLELGARGLRSLFSSKPSEREAARVLRYGQLAVRVLRAVFAADGPVDAEDQTTIAAVIAALGLAEADAESLAKEAPVQGATLDVYGDIEHGVARAIVRGAWLAAAGDGLDPREEQAIGVVAHKLGVGEDEVEAARREGQERVEARSKLGAAAVDGVRFILSDRVPGLGVSLAAVVGSITVPRRWRAEAMATIGQGAPVTLAKRHHGLSAAQRQAVLGVAWAAALMENPSLSRRAALEVRWHAVAADLGEDDPHSRDLVERWIQDALASGAKP